MNNDLNVSPSGENSVRLWLRLQFLQQQKLMRQHLALASKPAKEVFIIWPAAHDLVLCPCGLCDLSVQSNRRFLCWGQYGVYYGPRDQAFNFETCEVAATILMHFQDELIRHRVWPMYQREDDIEAFGGESEREFELRRAPSQ